MSDSEKMIENLRQMSRHAEAGSDLIASLSLMHQENHPPCGALSCGPCGWVLSALTAYADEKTIHPPGWHHLPIPEHRLPQNRFAALLGVSGNHSRRLIELAISGCLLLSANPQEPPACEPTSIWASHALRSEEAAAVLFGYPKFFSETPNRMRLVFEWILSRICKLYVSADYHCRVGRHRRSGHGIYDHAFPFSGNGYQRVRKVERWVEDTRVLRSLARERQSIPGSQV